MKILISVEIWIRLNIRYMKNGLNKEKFSVMSSEKRNIVIIGDGYVGKTCILQAIKGNNFTEQMPNVFDDFNEMIKMNGKEIMLHFIDSAGQEEYSMIRQLSYKDADLFLLCFSIDNAVSFENLESKWLPDLQEYNRVPIALLGTKSDLRQHFACIRKDIITKFQKQIKAIFYIECSAKNHNGIDDLKRLLARHFIKERSCILQ